MPPSLLPPQAAPATTPVAPVAPQAAATPPKPAPVVMDSGPADAHGIARLLDLLSPATRPHAEMAALIAASHLAADERAEILVPGVIDGVVGVLVVTAGRVLLANGRQWSPVIVEFAIAPGLTVEGWQDETYAQLTFEADQMARIEAILDKQLAFDAARIVRERIGS